MKNISILILALFSSLAQSAFNIPINIPGNIIRTNETYKNQICNQTCNDGVLKLSFMVTGEVSGEKKCPAQALPSDITLSCGAYLCADGKNCAVSCENNSKCASGFLCENRKCIPEKAISYFCSGDRTVNSSKGESWDCSPMVCQAGRCKERCQTTNDCIPGTVCDTSNGNCVYVR